MTLDLRAIDVVTSVIDIVAVVYGEAVSRYFSPAMYFVKAIELKDPEIGALESPE